MNPEKLDIKTMTMIVVACTVVVLGVLVIDVQIAKNLATRAQELDNTLRQREWPNAVARNPRSGGNHRDTAVPRVDPRIPVERDPGVAQGTDAQDPEVTIQGWDIFPVDRTSHTSAVTAHVVATGGNRNLEIPQEPGHMEP